VSTREHRAAPTLITVHHTSVSTSSATRAASYLKVTSQQGSVENSKRWRMIMKTILSTLVALSVLAGAAATSVQAAEFGSRDYWVERDANQN
jgi:uncharacterized protein YxeA